MTCGLVREKPAQPEQEPVAWGVFEGNLHDMFFTQVEAVEMAHLKGTHAEVKPLYTTPPQRTWVGLTDEDIWEAYMESPVELDCSTDELYALSRTVEAKLKDKNTKGQE
jgi:CBS-domain-containing membrane protein